MSETTGATMIVGGQWGDEGKGKLVDALAGRFDAVVRVAGGNNAGHTVVVEGERYAFHLVPSGMTNRAALGFLGNGVVIDPASLFEELDQLKAAGLDAERRLRICGRAFLVLPGHIAKDRADEAAAGDGKIGTTCKGIGPAYTSKASRSGVRVVDLFQPGLRAKVERAYRVGALPGDIDACVGALLALRARLEPLVVNGVVWMQETLRGSRVLVEGANATMLDLDFGTYPYVTSSSCAVGGACTGAAIPPSRIGSVVGIFKAYLTRVGAGPMPTELTEETGEHLQRVGREVGTTTGRRRRCGWFDAVAARYAVAINGFDAVNLTKLDVLSGLPKVRICVQYATPAGGFSDWPASIDQLEGCTPVYEEMPGWTEPIEACREWADLPAAARAYVRRLEALAGFSVRWVGVGPDREALLDVPRPE